MAKTKLNEVRSYFEPDVFADMERIRTTDPQFRRTSRSKFVEDCVYRCIQRLKEAELAKPEQLLPRGI
jgi:hypothetical protein